VQFSQQTVHRRSPKMNDNEGEQKKTDYNDPNFQFIVHGDVPVHICSQPGTRRSGFDATALSSDQTASR